MHAKKPAPAEGEQPMHTRDLQATSKTERTVSVQRAARETQYVLPLLLATGIANALAYVRDATIAAAFGATAQTDAYFVGTFVPILLSTIFVSSSLVPAFLPIFARHICDRVVAARLAGALISITAVLLIVLATAISAFAGPVVALMAPGWTAAQLDTAAMLLRITVPSTVAFGLSAILGAIGNAHHRYIAPPLGLAVSHLTVVAFTVALGSTVGILAPAWGMLLGSVLQLAVQVVALSRAKVRLIVTLDAPPHALRGIGAAVIPVTAYTCLAQIVPVLERWLASSLPPGQLSHLSYAMKLAMVPITVISASSIVVSFVAMSHDNASDNLFALRQTLGRGARLVSYLLITVSVPLIWLAGPVVDIALRHGDFTANDGAMTARLLTVYALGIVPNGLSALLTRSFQARSEYWIPLRTAMVNTTIYIGLALMLVNRWGILGLPVAFAATQATGAILLFLQQPPQLRRITHSIARQSAALLTVGVVASAAVAAIRLIAAVSGTGGRVQNLALLAAGGLVALGISVYSARALHVAEGAVLASWIRTIALAPLKWLRTARPSEEEDVAFPQTSGPAG